MDMLQIYQEMLTLPEGKILGLKTHDFHVLLQQLLSIGIKPYLKKDVCATICELSNFFQQMCANMLMI